MPVLLLFVLLAVFLLTLLSLPLLLPRVVDVAGEEDAAALWRRLLRCLTLLLLVAWPSRSGRCRSRPPPLRLLLPSYAVWRLLYVSSWVLPLPVTVGVRSRFLLLLTLLRLALVLRCMDSFSGRYLPLTLVCVRVERRLPLRATCVVFDFSFFFFSLLGL